MGVGGGGSINVGWGLISCGVGGASVGVRSREEATLAHWSSSMEVNVESQAE